MTQAELAAALGVPQQAVSAWERGITQPSGPGLTALVRLTGITELAFRTGQDFEADQLTIELPMEIGGGGLAKTSAKKSLKLPQAQPGEAWGVPVGEESPKALTRDEALGLVTEAMEQGGTVWIVVKPKAKGAKRKPSG